MAATLPSIQPNRLSSFFALSNAQVTGSNVVTNPQSFCNAVAVVGSLTASNLSQSGAAAFSNGTVSVQSALNLVGKLAVYGVCATSNAAFFSSNMTVAGNVSLSNASTTAYGLTSHSNASFFSSNVTVTGATVLSNAATVYGGLTASNTTVLCGTCWLGSNATNNKVLVLSDQGPSDAVASATAFYGLGYNANVLRYQAGTAGAHKWYTGTTNSLSIDSNGNVVAAANVTAYSDARLKTGIERIPDALDKIDRLGGYTYTRTDLPSGTGRCAGVLAQEVLAVLPEAAQENDGGLLSVSHGSLVGLLIEGIRELRQQVAELRAPPGA